MTILIEQGEAAGLLCARCRAKLLRPSRFGAHLTEPKQCSVAGSAETVTVGDTRQGNGDAKMTTCVIWGSIYDSRQTTASQPSSHCNRPLVKGALGWHCR